MINTKNVAYDINQVPREWVFEHYLNIPKLVKDVKVKSIFASEKTDSMFIYKDENDRFMFKDFSSGYHGDGVELVKIYLNLNSRWEATMKIINEFNKGDNKPMVNVTNITEKSNYKVVDWKERAWNNYDADFWLSFHIGSTILKKYYVRPLEYYVLESLEDNKSFQIKKFYVYGYFKMDGTLYKIYQPFNELTKFIKLSSYVQGMEQLDCSKRNLIVHKALKDIMFFDSLGYKTINCVAPDSENSLIPASIMYPLMYTHDKSCTLFDNDPAGIAGMKKYKIEYGLPYIVCPLSKDISDSGKDYGKKEVIRVFTSLIKNAFL